MTTWQDETVHLERLTDETEAEIEFARVANPGCLRHLQGQLEGLLRQRDLRVGREILERSHGSL